MLSKPSHLALGDSVQPRALDLLDPLLFAYFSTLHADQLSYTIGGLNFRLNNAIALLLLVLLLIRFRGSLFSIHRNLASGLGLVGISLLLSFFLSPYKSRCLFFLFFYGFTVLCYVFLPYFLIMRFGIQKVMRLYLFSFLAVGAYAVLQCLASTIGFLDPFAQQMINGIVRPNAFAFEPSFYALYMTAFVMLVNFHFLSAPKEPFFMFRSINAKKLSICNGLFLVSTATTAAFAYFVFFFVLLALSPGRYLPGFKKRFFYFALSCGACLALLGLIAPFLVKQLFLKFFFSGFMTHHSFFERWIGIQNAWKIFLEHPWAGIGLGGIPPYLMDAWLAGNERYTYLGAPILSRCDVVNMLKFFEPSNVCTELLASLGLIGLCAFSWLVFALVKQGKKALPMNPPLAFNLLISTLVMLIVLQFNQGLLRTYVWVHFALVFACLEKIAAQTTELSLSTLAQGKGVGNGVSVI